MGEYPLHVDSGRPVCVDSGHLRLSIRPMVIVLSRNLSLPKSQAHPSLEAI
jgi:hypothetical protein